MTQAKSWVATFSLMVVLVWAGAAHAAGPSWMPGFPMRMGSNVMLMWSPVPGATGYNLYKSNQAGELGPKLINLPMNNHMDMNVGVESSVYYTVKAVMADGSEGEAGPVGSLIAIKPLEPPKITGSLYQNDELSVRWDRIADAAFYNVLKGAAKDGPFELVGSIQEPKYVDTAVEPGKTYYYQVSAVDKNNVESPKSEVLEVIIEVKQERKKFVIYQPVARLVTFDGATDGGEKGPYRGPNYIVHSPVDDRLYATTGGDLIALDLEGNLLARIGKPEGYTGQWGTPICLAVDPTSGTLWSTWQQSEYMVRSFSPEGALLQEGNLEVPVEDYQAQGRDADLAEDRHIRPMAVGIAVDGEGEVWVADDLYGQVVIFDAGFNRIARLGGPRFRDKTDEATFKGVRSMVYSKQHQRVVLLDGVERRFRVFDSKANDFVRDADGTPFHGWPKAGSGAGYMQLPKGICIDGEGNLVVVAAAAGTLQGFDLGSPDLGYKFNYQTAADQPKIRQIRVPFGIAVVGKKVYVTESINDRLLIFTIQ